MELEFQNEPNVEGFGALQNLTDFVDGMDRFMNPDGRDKVAVPYDEVNKVPETTFRQLERFRWWAVPKYGPGNPPLSPTTRKRNGKRLAKSFPKKFVGDLGQVVDITEEFKNERFRDIQAFHEVISNEREEWDGNRPINKYLEHTNSGGVFDRNPYTCGAFAEQAETRDRNRVGFDQLIRKPVERGVLCRVMPRLLKGNRPQEPKPKKYKYTPPMDLHELPSFWRTNEDRNNFDVPYATGPLILPAPDAPVAAMGNLALGPAHLDPYWDNVFADISALEVYDPSAMAMYFQMDFHSRFRLCRKDLFNFLLYRVNFDIMGDLFMLPPYQLQERLTELLSTEDQAVVFG